MKASSEICLDAFLELPTVKSCLCLLASIEIFQAFKGRKCNSLSSGPALMQLFKLNHVIKTIRLSSVKRQRAWG